MNRHGGGIKRSSQLTFRRRLVLARLLLQGPASAETLIAAIQQELGADGYPAAAEAAFKHDLDALKSTYGCRIVTRRGSGVYMLEDLGTLALLRGSPEVHSAILTLKSQFVTNGNGNSNGNGEENHVEVRRLLGQLHLLAPDAVQSE